VSFVAQWDEIERGLPQNWDEARLQITVSDDKKRDRAAALLGPANPGRARTRIRFSAHRRGAGSSPELVRRLLRTLDRERIIGTLELVGSEEAQATPPAVRAGFEQQWDAVPPTLPPDWSDLFADVELRSSRDAERAALALSPLNPSAYGDRPRFRFRVARIFGYGASPQMTRRSLQRLDEQQVEGELHVLTVLSDTRPVATQGPVLRVAGKAV
jgi:hypothetical protein